MFIDLILNDLYNKIKNKSVNISNKVIGTTLSQKLTTKALSKFYQEKDWYEYYIKSEDLNLDSILESIFEEEFNFPKLEKINSVYNTSSLDIEYKLILRELNYHLKKLYGLKQSDRNSLVNQIKVLLEEGSRPISIVRLDIEKFYSNINKEELYEKVINNDNLLSYHHKYILKKVLFENSQFHKLKGLPFGLSLSATLSELFMRKFDESVKKLENVYFYARFVDDILIFCFRISDIREELSNLLPKSLNFHESSKNEFIKIDNNTNMNFEYLGYKFELRNKKLLTTIADNKIKKVKTRIVKSFLDYIKNKNIFLLEERIKFLTGNYILTSDSSEKELKNGIYFNYQLINDSYQLNELTQFLRKIIFSKNGSLGKKIYKFLNIKEKRNLSRYDFLVGFNRRIVYRFENDHIKRITKCWKND